jgi:hypothetical protein
MRPTGILAVPFGSLPLEWSEDFDGASQTGQPVTPKLPAANLLVPSRPLVFVRLDGPLIDVTGYVLAHAFNVAGS